jgi:hypothetical protein
MRGAVLGANRHLTICMEHSLFDGLQEFAEVPNRLVENNLVWNNPPSYGSCDFESVETDYMIEVGYVMDNCRNWMRLSQMIDHEYRRKNDLIFLQISWVFEKIREAFLAVHDKGFSIGKIRAEDIALRADSNEVEVRLLEPNRWGLNHPDLGMRRRPLQLNRPFEYTEYIQEEDWYHFFELRNECLLAGEKV